MSQKALTRTHEAPAPTHSSPELWGPAAWDTLANFSNGWPRNLPKDSQVHVQLFLLHFMMLLPCSTCARDATNLFLLRRLTDTEAANAHGEIPLYCLRFRNTVSLKIGRPLISYGRYWSKYGVDLRPHSGVDLREAPSFSRDLLQKLGEAADSASSSSSSSRAITSLAGRSASLARSQTPRRRYIRKSVERLFSGGNETPAAAAPTSSASSRTVTWDDEQISQDMRRYRREKQQQTSALTWSQAPPTPPVRRRGTVRVVIKRREDQ